MLPLQNAQHVAVHSEREAAERAALADRAANAEALREAERVREAQRAREQEWEEKRSADEQAAMLAACFIAQDEQAEVDHAELDADFALALSLSERQQKVKKVGNRPAASPRVDSIPINRSFSLDLPPHGPVCDDSLINLLGLYLVELSLGNGFPMWRRVVTPRMFFCGEVCSGSAHKVWSIKARPEGAPHLQLRGQLKAGQTHWEWQRENGHRETIVLVCRSLDDEQTFAEFQHYPDAIAPLRQAATLELPPPPPQPPQRVLTRRHAGWAQPTVAAAPTVLLTDTAPVQRRRAISLFQEVRMRCAAISRSDLQWQRQKDNLKNKQACRPQSEAEHISSMQRYEVESSMKMLFGFCRMEDWVCVGQHSVDLKLIVDSSRRRLSLELSFNSSSRRQPRYEYKVEWKFKELMTDVSMPDDTESVLKAVEVELLDGDGAQVAIFLSTTAAPLIYNQHPHSHGRRVDGQEGEAWQWKRCCTDPTPGGYFSNSFSFRLEANLVDPEIQSLRQVLAECDMLTEPPTPLRLLILPDPSRQSLDSLDFAVLYELQVLTTCKGVLNEWEIGCELVGLLRDTEPRLAVRVLKMLGGVGDHQRPICEDPCIEFLRIRELFHEALTRRTRTYTPQLITRAEAKFVLVRRVIVTPLRIVVLPEEYEISNRELRKVPSRPIPSRPISSRSIPIPSRPMPSRSRPISPDKVLALTSTTDRMLRVSFADENLVQIRADFLHDRGEGSFADRIRDVLSNGRFPTSSI